MTMWITSGSLVVHCKRPPEARRPAHAKEKASVTLALIPNKHEFQQLPDDDKDDMITKQATIKCLRGSPISKPFKKQLLVSTYYELVRGYVVSAAAVTNFPHLDSFHLKVFGSPSVGLRLAFGD